MHPRYKLAGRKILHENGLTHRNCRTTQCHAAALLFSVSLGINNYHEHK